MVNGPPKGLHPEYTRGIRDAARVCARMRATFKSATGRGFDDEEDDQNDAMAVMVSTLEDEILKLIGETTTETLMARAGVDRHQG